MNTQPEGATKYAHEQNLRIKMMLAHRTRPEPPRLNQREERSVMALMLIFSMLSLLGGIVALAMWGLER